jgi:hypothetical protein
LRESEREGGVDAEKFRKLLRDLSSASSVPKPPGTVVIRYSHVNDLDLGAVRRWVEAVGGCVDLIPREHPAAEPYFVIPAEALSD